MKNLKKNKVLQLMLSILRIPLFIPYFFIVRYVFKFKIFSPEETVRYLYESKKSISRFGDGEFNIILRNKSIGFQSYSEELSSNLISTLESNNEVKIALPHGLKNTKFDKLFIKSFWWAYVTTHYKGISGLIMKTKSDTFLDASFSRTITELKDKSKINKIISSTKKLWENKHIIMIEGKETRFGVGNDLFTKAQDVTRILAPTKSAFAKVDEIEITVKNLIERNIRLKGWNTSNIIVLLALGPTASILASRLSSVVQSIDIGHFDLQYEYLLTGKYKPAKIATRFDNEHSGGDKVATIENKDYFNSIYQDLS
ncbi:hypothetical protein FAM23282_02480 [Lentilactobacillus parabuchneri]|uniref:GT-D fold domain-containing glycosyltransferase n=1 Tax=Lentilactobacillus parabuchneri TaxID=152331 RepID=UPI000A123162|nr:GT-D fold domain-containing glycosyltransferase [Lentilactobacillus parabuchneri]ORN37654.1 hypothetical protein FAM23282_02480 [Lentilactobacillus parabuchneri]